MEQHLIDYILELVEDSDVVCEELHQDENEMDYCSNNCTNLKEECIRRLMYKRILK